MVCRPDWSRRRQAEVVAEVEFVVAWLVATALLSAKARRSAAPGELSDWRYSR